VDPMYLCCAWRAVVRPNKGLFQSFVGKSSCSSPSSRVYAWKAVLYALTDFMLAQDGRVRMHARSPLEEVIMMLDGSFCCR
jgi:hypothetical protein